MSGSGFLEGDKTAQNIIELISSDNMNDHLFSREGSPAISPDPFMFPNAFGQTEVFQG